MTGATTTPTTEASSSKSSCIEDQTTTTCCTESESEAKANANAARATATATQPPSQSVITLLIENPGKGKNWGPLLRCCAAFGIRTIYVVGYDKCDIRGSHGASKHVTLKAFPTHEQAARALTAASSSAAASNTSTNDEGGFELVGLLSPPLDSDDDDFDEDRKVVREQFFYEPAETEVEIARIAEKGNGGKKAETTGTEQQAQTQIQISFPVHLRNRFPRKTCLVVDKMKRGLPWSLAKHCSSFVHVPHSNFNGSGSMLTLEASVSIVFHEAINAGLVGHATDEDIADDNDNDTTNYEGQKYHVETIHKGGHPSDTEARQRKRKEREDKLKVLQDEAEAKHESIFFGDNNTNNVDDGDY
jgi:tRNA G18 (ribose-2'-O)-methylase SpoU